MMRLPMILAIARAEIRSVRRLIRYWVFALLSVASTLLAFGYYTAVHAYASRFSATVGVAGPRYLMSGVGLYFVLIFLLGLIFLAFDVRARDERERIAEVLDSRPVSNPEFLLGRGLGLVAMAWGPVLCMAAALQALGALAVTFDWYGGEPIEPYSLAGFLLAALSMFTLWCAVVMLLAVLVRNRLVVALAALALAGLHLWIQFRLPVYLQPALGMLNVELASDLVPSLAGGVNVGQRLAAMILAAGCLALAAAFHPRRDGGSKSRRIALGAGLAAAAGLIVTALTWQAAGKMDDRAAWLAAHEARRDDPRADLQAVAGTVRVEPGRRVALDLEITVQAPPDRGLDTLLFTFNPGFAVERARRPAGKKRPGRTRPGCWRSRPRARWRRTRRRPSSSPRPGPPTSISAISTRRSICTPPP